MRAMPVFATLLVVLPIAAFVATWIVTDGAPLRAPGAGTAKPVVFEPPRTDRPGQPPAGAAAAGEAAPISATVPDAVPAGAPAGDLGPIAARAAEGDRDALLFLTLMRMAEHGPVPMPRDP